MGGTDDVAGHAFFIQKFLAGILDLHSFRVSAWALFLFSFGGRGQKYMKQV
jgi:hypothetical protein